MSTDTKPRKVETKQIVCENCSKTFEKPLSFLKQHPTTRFCNMKCSKEYSSKNKKGQYIKCKRCQKSFYVMKSRTKTQFCSNDCKLIRDDEKKLYKHWENMKARCNQNSIATQYAGYRDRKTNVCDEWINNFFTFKKWALENGYEDKLSLDRRDNNGDYEPSNCRWVTQKTQSANTRKLWSTNTSGFRGVLKRRKRYIAQIMVNYKSIYLGTFDTGKEASLARDKYIVDHNLPHTLTNTEGLNFDCR